ncbi:MULTISPECIES: type I glyceraldehyde-3-phosphate dehydrogenase [Paenibacillus]|uniref:type I glyceraldehyde-3-phosphate dehydrogenase n=1 Tax=Paenibacillus TaxID=44249 RepID=UPI0022B8CCDC|nr:type I glyceraldehyde-3-phosphate dehydrogenase [Paenibacillus caseinilyticus]MCZ8520813.1 type I glyceraldehyde-3-phosphate dehydrogenase [Paenibacillus caseinilyticus]
MKVTKGIGISGMGRIGRLLVRKLFSGDESGLVLKAINCVYPAETVAHLLKYDTVHGRWDAEVGVEDGRLVINGRTVRIVGERDPEKLPWRELGVELVLDATGKFNHREGAGKHLAAGASGVILTAPGKDVDLTVVMGVNDGRYEPDRHRILSAASCTTNCLAPVLHILDSAFGVVSGWMTTVHSFTSDQNHLDNPHKDLRRARACTQSIVPTSTGVGKALGDVLPHLAPHIQGLSLRVPTQDVSLVDLTAKVKRKADAAEVRRVFREAAEGAFSRYVDYTEEPLVSVDFVGSSKSAVIDGLSIAVLDDSIKVLAWYDNEWAYACRVVELAELTAERKMQPWQNAVLI